MGISLAPRHLRRYRDIGKLLLKHGDLALVRRVGLEEALGGEAPGPEGVGRAEDLAIELEALGPTFIKLGQLLSTRGELLRPEYAEALARLQDRCEPVAAERIVEVVEEELGTRITNAFSGFEEHPLAAASLGQVHAARLRDGRPVAVKVQRPDIRDTVEADLEALEEIARFTDRHTRAGRRYRFGDLLAEFEEVIREELDYTLEARNLETLADALEPFERIVVPRPVADYTTSRVLTMDFVEGRNIGSLHALTRIEMDGKELLDELFEAYLHQALVLGMIHADPHPGNVFLTETGCLALLDLGMVVHLAPDLQEILLRLLLAVADGRGDEVADIAERAADPEPDFDRAHFRREVGRLVTRHYRSELEEVPVGRVVLDIYHVASTSGLRVPPELSIIGKALLNLDRVAELLDPDFQPAEAVRRHAGGVLRKRALGALKPTSSFRTILDAKEFAEGFPRRIDRVLDRVAGNDLEVRVRIADDRRILGGMQKIANRITVGIVLAALIVGASLLMRVETPFTLFGYPGFAIFLFVMAAAGGVALIIDILRDRGDGDAATRRRDGRD